MWLTQISKDGLQRPLNMNEAKFTWVFQSTEVLYRFMHEILHVTQYYTILTFYWNAKFLCFFSVSFLYVRNVTLKERKWKVTKKSGHFKPHHLCFDRKATRRLSHNARSHTGRLVLQHCLCIISIKSWSSPRMVPPRTAFICVCGHICLQTITVLSM